MIPVQMQHVIDFVQIPPYLLLRLIEGQVVQTSMDSTGYCYIPIPSLCVCVEPWLRNERNITSGGFDI
jgi:hypothetical protein